LRSLQKIPRNLQSTPEAIMFVFYADRSRAARWVRITGATRLRAVRNPEVEKIGNGDIRGSVFHHAARGCC
jgi:hypothetical protein